MAAKAEGIWVERLKLAAESGGVSLSEHDCVALIEYIRALRKCIPGIGA